jgi:hypothetical protein
MFFEPGNGPRSSRITECPERASTVAAVGHPVVHGELAGQRIEGRVRVADDREIRHGHHRAVRVGVDADDVVRRAQAGGVLHGATDPECEVQRRVDDDAGRADLLVVVHPPAVGDHPRCAK